VPTAVLSDLDIDDPPDGKRKTEGGRRVVVSSRVERDPSLRAAALRLHGHDCMACGFNFGRVFGKWGEGYAEFHHLVALGKSLEPRETDPASDLAILCANCHRMAHRRRDLVLDLDELRAKLDAAAPGRHER
jgi:5-methylcytosine-specific restriction protein A